MKRYWRDKWADACEDGRPQAQGTLEAVDDTGKVIGQCCLGVLCEVVRSEHPEIERRVETRQLADDIRNVAAYDNTSGILPRTVARVVGDDLDPILSNGNTLAVASAWNDRCKATLPEIAKMIRNMAVEDEAWDL